MKYLRKFDTPVFSTIQQKAAIFCGTTLHPEALAMVETGALPAFLLD
ncbi:hypothetical protein RSSM_01027 [Rhodopirellula sallentina SM41]|uniref:Uncharacterized protein n=1 Tax=Rhodopirellula sallentina SM41 TaxID=1263870 RepID=M5U7U0_9BACT|nr:hypothetical protein RSSM_01027 [Rhodopirellula sallentina SM41]